MKKRLDDLIKPRSNFFADYEGVIKDIEEAWLEIKKDVKEKSKDIKKHLAALKKNAKSRARKNA